MRAAQFNEGCTAHAVRQSESEATAYAIRRWEAAAIRL
jgi:hypothetical protein